jgi:hypothetical protein
LKAAADDLYQLAQSYLEAEGYTVEPFEHRGLVGTKQTVGGVEEHYVLLVPSTFSASREAQYQTTLAIAHTLYPESQKVILAESSAGFSQDFRQGVSRWYKARLLVPAQFFDSTFRWEEARATTTALRELRNSGETKFRRRVPQPFRTDDGRTADDLLSYLLTSMENGSGNPIKFVVGPAGAGKSHLFDALFYCLYENFIGSKQSQRLASRPMPLLPQYAARAHAPRVKSLLRSFLDEEFTRPLTERVFEWRLTHGMATWLLDGLDEIIAADPDFFDYLLDLATRDGLDTPQILVCVRDSLVATNEDFRNLLDSDDSVIEVLHLEPWGDKSKRAYASFRLGDQGDSFLKQIQASETLTGLSSTAYYLELLADRFQEKRFPTDEGGESALLDAAVEAILARDFEKGLLDRLLVSEAVVGELVESLAAEDFDRSFAGIPAPAVRELAEACLSNDVSFDERKTFLSNITQLALFAGGELGQVRFAQELLEQHLLGRYLASLLGHLARPGQASDLLVKRLGRRRLASDGVALRTLSQRIRGNRDRNLLEDALGKALVAAVSEPTAFANVLQCVLTVASGAGEHSSLLERVRTDISFEGRDLSGLRFDRVDLSRISFRRANLADTAFISCRLAGTQFDEALFIRTIIRDTPPGGYEGLSFGSRPSIQSLIIDGQEFTSPSAVSRHLIPGTDASASLADPCEAAREIRFLIYKFLLPSGQPKRDWLDSGGMKSGKRVAGINRDDALDALVRAGYLQRNRDRNRFERAKGNAWDDMVQFAQGRQPAQGITEVLDDLCDKTGPSHQHMP